MPGYKSTSRTFVIEEKCDVLKVENVYFISTLDFKV